MEVDTAIQQVLDYYNSINASRGSNRDDVVYNIFVKAKSSLTSAEVELVLEKIGDPVSRMTVQRSIIRLIKEGSIVYKGRVVRLDVTGKKMYIPAYGVVDV